MIIWSPYETSIQNVKDFIAPPPRMELYSLGMKPQLADGLWLRAIQDFDYCENLVAKNTCRGNSWLYKMIDSVTTLDAKYEIAYSVGGLALTILISDYDGASKIFDRGVKEFPTEWNLLYRAAYHALYEEKDFKKASELFKKAGKYGAPEWTLSLSNRLMTKKGRLEISERILGDMVRREESEILIRRMREIIEEIKNLPE
jgi:tetratricopeptide (TPR) repeat protein